jgi:hypothetical protein
VAVGEAVGATPVEPSPPRRTRKAVRPTMSPITTSTATGVIQAGRDRGGGGPDQTGWRDGGGDCVGPVMVAAILAGGSPAGP